MRATEYFVEAVGNPSGFVAKQCSSYFKYKLGLCKFKKSLSIGSDLTVADAGLFYLKTNSEAPYSIE